MRQKICLISATCILLGSLTVSNDSYAENITNESTAYSVGSSASTYVLQSRISASADDAEERINGRVSLTSSDLELVSDHNSLQTVGMRFTKLSIPKNAIINKAYIQYKVDERSINNADLTIHGESTANASGFIKTDYNISDRIKTQASVLWSPAVWDAIGASGEEQRTSDLSAIVQEIVSATGWESDNAIAFILSGAGTRIAEAYDGDKAGAPVLYLEYTTDASINPPVVEEPVTEEPVVEEPIVEEPLYIQQSRVSASADDAEERIDGRVDLTSSDLELVFERDSQQTIGLRFSKLSIPENAVISKAYIQFKVDERSENNADFTIHGERTANASGFTNTDYNISDRIRTQTSALWSPAVWDATGESGAKQRTTDLSSIVQEIISTSGWESDNAIAFILSGAGTRIAEAYDGDKAGAPLLYVEYTTDVSIIPPVVEEPVIEEPVIEEPVVEEPVVEEPVVEEPVVEEPVVEEPVVGEPVSEFELLNVTGNNADLIEGSFTPSNIANLGTQSKRPMHQGGFGTDSVCGLRGEIIKVTNLNDSGSGSLRDAINRNGPRTIVFEVSGAIKLESRLDIDSPFVTIAGQTAPPPGISIYHQALRVNTHDVCMQHMRVRLGDSDHNLNPINPEDAGDADALVIRGGRDSEGTYNVVLDNMSVSWSVDEAIAVFGGVSNLTIRDSIIAEPLRYNAHGKDHAYCLLIRSESERVSLIGNLFGHCQRRSPRMDGGTLQYVNNVVYNPGSYAVSVHDYPIDITMVGNVMDFPDDSANRYEGGADEFLASRSPKAKVYFLDNKSFEDRPMHEAVEQGEPVVLQSNPRVWEGNVTALTVAAVEESFSDWVGAFPRYRDEVDERIIEGVSTHTGNYLDSQMDNGGYVYIEENQRRLTPPDSPQNDDNGNGISNLVEWLQSYTDAIE